jgi:hypothetical protein
VVAEAMARGARAIAPARDTGSFSGDLISFLTDSFAGLQDSGISRALRQLASGAVHDEHVAKVLTKFTAQRRAPLRALLERGVASGDIAASADLDMVAGLRRAVVPAADRARAAGLRRGSRPRRSPDRGRAGRERAGVGSR